MSQFIGPALPPHLRRSSNDDDGNNTIEHSIAARVRRTSSSASSKTDAEDVLVLTTDPSDEMFPDETKEESYGPSLPPRLAQSNVIDGSRDRFKMDKGRKREGISEQIKVQLFTVSSADSNSDVRPDLDNEKSVGPQLPPHLIQQNSSDDEAEVDSSSYVGSTELQGKRLKDTNILDDSQEDDEQLLGPALPPSFRTGSIKVERQECIGPALPPQLKSVHSAASRHEGPSSDNGKCIGSQLPSQVIQDHHSDVESETISTRRTKYQENPVKDSSVLDNSGKDDQQYLGPALPPGFRTKTSQEESREYVGPALPPGFKLSTKEKSDNPERVQGPALPPGFKAGGSDVSSDSDSEAVGPQLIPDINNQTQRQLEMRARMLRHDMATARDAVDVEYKRESWMLELPPEKAVNLGMGPRQFRKKERLDPGDRTVWTDTPADRMRKKLNPKSEEIDESQLKMQAMVERDEVMGEMAEKHSSKRGKQSLLEMHQDKLKKKKKKDEKEGKTQERRPFSRELDLQTNRFDEAQKKSIFNKARLLNDRFSAGQSKYL